jgi:hypothetical protein
MSIQLSRGFQRWQAAKWSDIIGNRKLKEALRNLIRCVRQHGNKDPYAIFAYGVSRGGKTSTIQYAIKCMLCDSLDLQTLDACGRCQNCTTNVDLYGDCGWGSFVDPAGANDKSIRFFFVPIDCARVTEAELEEILLKIQGHSGLLVIVYLDEFHRLARRRMDEKILKAMDSYPVIWLASSAVTDELDNMVMNRCDEKIEIELPSVGELTDFLAERCKDFGVWCPGNAQETLTRLAKRAQRIPGLALPVLRKASRTPDLALTLEMVNQHVFII